MENYQSEWENYVCLTILRSSNTRLLLDVRDVWRSVGGSSDAI